MLLLYQTLFHQQLKFLRYLRSYKECQIANYNKLFGFNLRQEILQ